LGEGRESPASAPLHPRVRAAEVGQIATEGLIADAFELRRDAAGLIEKAEEGDRAPAGAGALAIEGGFLDFLLLDLLLVRVADRLVCQRASSSCEYGGAGRRRPAS
jgi:hypothetical protein